MDFAIIPEPPDSPLPNFQLAILNETATEVVAVFDASEHEGLAGQLVATLEPSGACKALTFTGRPDLVKAPGRQCVLFRVNDGTGWREVFFGTVVKGWAVTAMEEVKPYTASAEALLNAHVTDGKIYPAQDPALIAQDLAKRLKHPALGMSEIDFPNTGTTLEGGFDFAGATLGDAFAALAESVKDAGVIVNYGVDARGNLFFKANTKDPAQVAYHANDFVDLEVDSQDVCTAVLWVLGNTPSDEGFIGQYRPKTLMHLSVPDPELHARYNAVKARSVSNSREFMLPYRPASVASLNYADAANAIDDAGGEANNATFATRLVGLPNQVGYLRIIPSSSVPVTIIGVSVDYQMGYDVAPPDQLILYWNTVAPNGAVATTGFMQKALPYSPDNISNFTALFPPWGSSPRTQYKYHTSDTWPDGSEKGIAEAVIIHPSNATGTVKIYDFRFLILDTARLDAMAAAELKTPSKLPGQVTPRNERGQTYYVAPTPKVLFTGLEEDRRLPAAEFRISFDMEAGVQTLIDIEEKNNEDETAEIYANLRLAIDKNARLSEIKSKRGGRL